MSIQQTWREAPGPVCPGWVPEAVRHYLDHTETGKPIRALARASDCHASTVLRRVRRLESRRDDPLVDGALRDLSRRAPWGRDAGQGISPEMAAPEAEVLRCLRRLCESGAVLAVGKDMDQAVVVRETEPGVADRTAVVKREVAQILALNDWIASPDPSARVARYRVTGAGRSALRAALGTGALPGGEACLGDAAANSQRPPSRGAWAESPLAILARRRGQDGRPFLPRKLVEAGERLLEDFELAQMQPRVAQDWSSFLTARTGSAPDGRCEGSSAASAQARLEAALSDLGPGLGDVALRCCCYQEGMEEIERRMGWAARSGKVVLRIALLQLKLHYERQGAHAPRLG